MTMKDTGGSRTGPPPVPVEELNWLVASYRADMDVVTIKLTHGPMTLAVLPGDPDAQPACRCYRCGGLLTVDTVRFSGGPLNGSIRPACGPCDDLIRGA